MVLDLGSLYGNLTNMAFVIDPEGWMAFQQAQMPGMAYQKKKKKKKKKRKKVLFACED